MRSCLLQRRIQHVPLLIAAALSGVGAMTRFTPRMTRFVAEYQVDANGAQAAIRAGYSPRAAAVTAWNLLQKPAVREAVAAGEQRTFEAIEIEAGRVLDTTADV